MLSSMTSVGDIFPYKIFLEHLAYFKSHHFKKLKPVKNGYILGRYWKNVDYLLFQHLVHYAGVVGYGQKRITLFVLVRFRQRRTRGETWRRAAAMPSSSPTVQFA